MFVFFFFWFNQQINKIKDPLSKLEFLKNQIKKKKEVIGKTIESFPKKPSVTVPDLQMGSIGNLAIVQQSAQNNSQPTPSKKNPSIAVQPTTPNPVKKKLRPKKKKTLHEDDENVDDEIVVLDNNEITNASNTNTNLNTNDLNTSSNNNNNVNTNTNVNTLPTAQITALFDLLQSQMLVIFLILFLSKIFCCLVQTFAT